MIAKETIACILANDFEDTEVSIPRRALEGAGFELEFIGTKDRTTVTGKKHKTKALIGKSIDDAEVSDYVGLLIPGGYSPDQLRADDRFVKFVRDFDASHKLIAAVCHGPQLLLTAGLVKGRTLTAWTTVRGDLEKAGAHVEDEPVVVDGNWITSRMPDDLDAFSAQFIEALGGEGDQAQEAEEEPVEKMISEGSPAHS
jgi:protease I